jgi:secreted trypsin-like serine protease
MRFLGRPLGRRHAVAIAAVAVAAATAGVTAGLIGGTAPAGAVANGTVVQQGQYRFAAKFTFTGVPAPDGTRYDSACSGGLISAQWVISAGHCFHDKNRVRINGRPPYTSSTVTIGRADVRVGIGVVRTIVDVKQSTTNDIALVKLDAPVVGITPMALPKVAPKVGEVVRLTGYGATSSTNPAPSMVLRTGQFTVAAISQPFVGMVGRAPARNTSACLYDSGAPYFRDIHPATLVSVESSGPNCPHAQRETTSRVDTVLAWINSTIKH